MTRTPDDIVALAMYATTASTPHLEVDVEPHLAWDPNRPILESWANVRFRNGKPLGRSLPPRGEYALEFLSHGELRSPETRFERERLRIDWELSVDASRLPMLRMRILGAPIARLYFPHGKLRATFDERRAVLDVLEPTLKFVLKQLGALRKENYRPSTGNDFNAAVLHFHRGLSWKEVAKKLCRIQHTHNPECEAKCAQPAKRYYKRVKDRFSLS